MSIPEHLSQSSNDIDPNETPESLAALVQQMRGQLQGALRGNWHMEAHKKMRGWEEMMDEVARLAKRA